MSSNFVHCHCHSSYSLLDGLGRIDDLVTAARLAGMPALALTDHGTMFGAIDFYSKAKEAEIKPIIGCEVYVADQSLEVKPGAHSKTSHLVLLAENETGYRNLLRLSSEAHLRGFYRKPRVDHALLEQCSDGLICLSGCASSELAKLILEGSLAAAEEQADWYRSVFADRYYLELQYHEIAIQTTINQGIVHLSQKLGLPLIATNDVHYVSQRQARTHEILLCIQTQSLMSDPKRMRMETEEFYLKSAEQMELLFGSYPGAMANSLAIAERCNLELSFGRPQLPKFETPSGQTSDAYLRELSLDGLSRRYQEPALASRERLDYELSVIASTGFADYLLLIYDVIHFARSRQIPVGPGRGSAAGSLIAYCLYLTNVDPMAHGLSFERFLNVERVNMPDMDLDFADDRRDEVIQYVTEKYGRDRVAQIITFGTIGPRAGVRDVGRVIGRDYGDVDKVAKLVPLMCSKVSKAKQEVPEIQQLYDSDPGIKDLLDTVEDLEGVARHASTHAAGVVIARDPLIEHVPLYKAPKTDQLTTQYAMGAIEKIGLLKIDFLGLRTLTILDRAARFVEQSTGRPMDLDSIPLEDPSIYELLVTGESFGIFQVDGSGMRKLLRDLGPTEFNHVVAVIALYRPGPMEHIPEFVARKNGLKDVQYDHPALREVLEETYGIVVYQEQVMTLAVRVAGYSMGEADLLRRAMGKKKPAELAQHRQSFIERASAKGTDAATARRLFDIVEPFAGYAFGKAHAAAYAVITCQTAFLKANFPREYLAGWLSAEKENAEKIADGMAECTRLGIKILPPDINQSGLDFTLEDGGIRFGLSAIKNVGAGVIESILEARQTGGSFASLENFCTRVDWACVNKRVVDSLARAGAFDSLGIERQRILASLDRLVAFGGQLQRAALAGQASIFGESSDPPAMLQLAVSEPATREQRLQWELELLGVYVSPHPLAQAEAAIHAAHALLVGETGSEHENKRILVGGMVRSIRSFSTRDGRPMATFQLAGLQATMDAVIFSRRYEQLQARLVDGVIVIAEGKFDASDGGMRLLVDDVFSVDEAADRPASVSLVPSNGSRHNGSNGNGKHSPEPTNHGAIGSSAPSCRLLVEIQRTGDRSADLDRVERLYTLLQRYRGADEVEIRVGFDSRLETVPLPNARITCSPALAAELDDLLPPGSWRIDRIAATA